MRLPAPRSAMRHAAVLALAAALLLLPAAPRAARAQAPGSADSLARTGRRVRLWLTPGATRTRDYQEPEVVTGQLVRLGADSVVVDRGGRLVAVPRAQVTQLAVSVARASRGRGALRGAGIGFLVGGVTGATLAGLTYTPCSPGEWICLTRSEAMAFGGALLGAGGIVVGGIVGAARGGERWRAVPVPEVAAGARLQVAPRGVMLSLRF